KHVETRRRTNPGPAKLKTDKHNVQDCFYSYCSLITPVGRIQALITDLQAADVC
ncbi:hypothetical protein XENOCAPTIV_028875, partial [Xenoophorus captivus]